MIATLLERDLTAHFRPLPPCYDREAQLQTCKSKAIEGCIFRGNSEMAPDDSRMVQLSSKQLQEEWSGPSCRATVYTRILPQLTDEMRVGGQTHPRFSFRLFPDRRRDWSARCGMEMEGRAARWEQSKGTEVRGFMIHNLLDLHAALSRDDDMFSG